MLIVPQNSRILDLENLPKTLALKTLENLPKTLVVQLGKWSNHHQLSK
jgi:hypothetical protein